MLSNTHDTERREKNDPCASFGSLALEAMPADDKEKEASVINSGGITYTTHEADTLPPDNKPSAAAKLPEDGLSPSDTADTPQPCRSYRIKPARNVYIPVGTGYSGSGVKYQPDGTPSSPGLIYEVAEELYVREKTASELEALCQPPFRKVFDSRQQSRLDHRAAERTSRIVSEAAGKNAPKPEPAAVTVSQKPLTTGSAFALQLLLMLPVVNLIAAMIYSFRSGADSNKKAICRGYLIWLTVFLSAALVFFAFCFFSDPENTSRLTEAFPFLRS